MSELDEIMYQIKVYDDEYRKNIPDEFRMSLDNGKHYGRATQVYDFTKHRYIVEYVSDNYDIHTEIQTLLQENKQLKSANNYLQNELYDLKREKTPNYYHSENVNLRRINNNYKSILSELEEWLNKETKLCDDYLIGECHTDYTDVLNKIQELKEKYK